MIALVQDFESCNIQEFQLGHIMKLTKTKAGWTDNEAQLKMWTTELDSVRQVLDGLEKNLDFVTLQLRPFNSSTSPTATDIAQLISDVRAHSELNSKPHHKRLRIGLDLDTNFFVSSSSSSTWTATQLISLLQPLTASLDVMTVATNAMTHKNASALLQWARETGSVTTYSTEVMRAHHLRPGMLPLNFDHESKHRTNNREKVGVDRPAAETLQLADADTSLMSAQERMRVNNIHAAVDDLKMAMDRCIGVERKYLNEVCNYSSFSCRLLLHSLTLASLQLSKKYPTSVPASSVCLAHVLVNQMDQIIFPEEFAYVKKTQVRICHSQLAVWLSERGAALCLDRSTRTSATPRSC